MRPLPSVLRGYEGQVAGMTDIYYDLDDSELNSVRLVYPSRSLSCLPVLRSFNEGWMYE